VKISQIFGPTIQGEGSAAGRHVLFVRMYNCNLRCTWCDTAYTWADTADKAEMTQSGIQYDRFDPKLGEKEMAPEEVMFELEKLWPIYDCPTIIVFSGGEPMMQQGDLVPLMRLLRPHNHEIHVETAGTIPPAYDFNALVTQYNVSPKLSNSGNLLAKRLKPTVLRILEESGKAWFKFVVTSNSDFEEIDEIVATVGIRPKRVMVMPEGTTAEQNITTARVVVDEAIIRGYGLSFRTHVLIWGNDPDK